MALSPHKFYNMDNEDFFLSMEGHKEMIADRKRDLRRLASIAGAQNLRDAQSIYGLWPVVGDDELKKEVEEQRQLTQEQHNQNMKKLVGLFKKSSPN